MVGHIVNGLFFNRELTWHTKNVKVKLKSNLVSTLLVKNTFSASQQLDWMCRCLCLIFDINWQIVAQHFGG